MYESSLGAIVAGATVATAVQGLVPKILQSSDPIKDTERKARIDQAFADAMAGRATTTWGGQTYPAVTCLRDMATDPPNAVCGVGSAYAKLYAKAKWAEYQGRVAAGRVGIALVGQSPIPSTAVTVVKSAAVPILAVGLALWLLRRR